MYMLQYIFVAFGLLPMAVSPFPLALQSHQCYLGYATVLYLLSIPSIYVLA
jgi:hypothetical protein